MNPIIFMDVDGVLNNHTKYPNGYCGTKFDCVQRLNWLLYETGAKIVVSSAWRYLILEGSMTLKGFESLLLTHGVDAHERIVGHTCSDKDAGYKRPEDGIKVRCVQIRRWLDDHRRETGADPGFLVLDDLDLRTIDATLPLVLVDGAVGLTEADVWEGIELLRRQARDRLNRRTEDAPATLGDEAKQR